MTVLATERKSPERAWKHKRFTLLSGTKAFQGGAIFYSSNGKVVPAQHASATRFLGVCRVTVDATTGDQPVEVDLIEEMTIRGWVNATASDAVAATDAGKPCYFLDDQTVQITPTKRFAGVVRDVIDGRVFVQHIVAPGDAPIIGDALPAFVAADLVVPSSLQSGAVYDIPTTAAVSTVTLPAAAPDGTSVQFAADGVKNGHTIQYRDATGTVALTTALLASKRHLVVATKLGGKWFANAYVSP